MNNQQLKAHCEDVIANPQDHSEMEFAMAKALLPCLEAEPVAWVVHGHGGDQLTDDGDYVANVEGMHGARATSLYRSAPVPELKPVKMPQRYTTRIGTDLVSGAEVTRVVMIPDEYGQWLSIYDVEHEFNRMRGIPS